MAADILGQGMHDDICAKLDRLAQDRRGDGVIHHQRYAAGMGDVGQGLQVDDIACRVADAFAVHQLGVVVDQLGDGLGRVIAGEAHINAEARQQVGEQGVGAAVQLWGGDDIVAGTGQGLDGIVNGRAARRHVGARHGLTPSTTTNEPGRSAGLVRFPAAATARRTSARPR